MQTARAADAAVLCALYPIVEPNDRRPRRRIFPRQDFNIFLRNARPLRYTLGRVFRQALLQLVEAFGVTRDVILVVPAFADDDMHQSQRESDVGSGIDGDVPVGNRCRARAIGIDDDELGAIAARLFDERPQMNVVAVNIRGPGDDVLRMTELLRLGAHLAAIDGDDRILAGLRADAAMQPRRSQAMEEAAVHRSAVQHGDVAAIGIRQNRFRTELRAGLLQPPDHLVVGVVPRDALEDACAVDSLRREAAHGIKHAIGRVNTIQIFRNFAAEKSARDGMFGVALNFCRSAVLDSDEHGAAVRAIMRTG